MALNWGAAAKSGISGAGLGATLGPWGAAIGGGIGGLAGLLSGDAENDSWERVPTGTNEQEMLHKNILSRAMGMSNGGGFDLANRHYNKFLGDNQQEAYNQFSAPYLQQFQEQILPQIAERFAARGALSSSGFGQALGGASAGLQSQLAQLFSNLQGQAAQQQYGQYNQLSQMGLNYNPFAYSKNKGTLGFGGSLAQGLTDPDNMEGIINGIMSLFKKKE